MRSLAVFMAASTLIALSTAHAVRPIRCNGRIQYRPCEEQPKKAPRRTVVIEDVEPRDPRNFAQIVERTFERDGSDGKWSGTVRGFGDISLTLVLKENGAVRETRKMGSVPLGGTSTTFTYRSVIPRYERWSWDIVATADNLPKAALGRLDLQ